MNLTNLLKIFSFILPLLILFILFINSIIYNDYLKIIILCLGLFILIISNFILKIIFKEPINLKSNPLCHVTNYLVSNSIGNDKNNFFIKIINTFLDGLTKYTMPPLGISVISFITSYLIYPMIQNNNYNYIILMLLFISCIFVFVNDYYNLCSNNIGILFGILLGILISIIYISYINILETKNRKLLYFSYIPQKNNKCKQVGNTFICNKHVDSKSLKYENDINNNNLTSMLDKNIYKLPCTYNKSLDPDAVDCSNYLLPLRKKDKCDVLSSFMDCGTCLTDIDENAKDSNNNPYFPDKYRNRDLNSHDSVPIYKSRITNCIREPSFNLINLPNTSNKEYSFYALNSGDNDVCTSVSNTLGCKNLNFSNEDLCRISTKAFREKNLNNFSLVSCPNFNNRVKGTKINIYSLNGSNQQNLRGNLLKQFK
jgi:hypothetical protein